MSVFGYFNTKADSAEQLDAFNTQHCDFIYYDERQLLETIGAGDLVVLNELYDAGSSLNAAFNFIHKVHEAGADFLCVGSDLDTRRSPDVYKTLDAIYKLFRAEASSARREGSAGSSRRGGGRGRARISEEAISEALDRYQAGESVKSVCQSLGISQGTLYKYIRERGVERASKED